MTRTKIVNYYAGPGTGKSTTAAALFAELKYRGVNCELVQEPAKWATWERRGEKYLKDQMNLFAEQHFKFNILKGEVDIIVTDSPLFMGLVYVAPDYFIPALSTAMRQAYNQFDNIDIFLERNPERPYDPNGRIQTPEEAIEKDKKVRGVMRTYTPEYLPLQFNRETPLATINLMCGVKGWHNTIPQLKEI